MKKILSAIIGGILVLAAACSTLQPVIDDLRKQEADCKSAGGAFVFGRGCVMPKPAPPMPPDPPTPEPLPAPEPTPAPTPSDGWMTFQPGESVIVPHTPNLTFDATGIDSRIVREWHILDLAHGRGHGETANAHLMIYDDRTLYFIQQIYSPSLLERRHEDYWAFRPDKIYQFQLNSTLAGYRLTIKQDGQLVVDMPQASFGNWPAGPFAQIDNIRIGCGTFPSHPCPKPIKVKIYASSNN